MPAKTTPARLERQQHDALAQLAVKWLKQPMSRGGPGCQVAFSEARNGFKDGEIPDAIGYRAGVWDEGTVLVEVKVSRADFLADAKKPHRMNPAMGVGLYRYYLAPKGMINPKELPSKWGLIEVCDKGRLRAVVGRVMENHCQTGYVDHWRFEERNIGYELSLLVRMVYRVGDLDKFNRQYREDQRIKSSQARQLDTMREELREAQRSHRLEIWRLERALKEASGVISPSAALPKTPTCTISQTC